jgi:hypothetical protein
VHVRFEIIDQRRSVRRTQEGFRSRHGGGGWMFVPWPIIHPSAAVMGLMALYCPNLLHASICMRAQTQTADARQFAKCIICASMLISHVCGRVYLALHDFHALLNGPGLAGSPAISQRPDQLLVMDNLGAQKIEVGRQRQLLGLHAINL